jgi:hypothetical protein
MAHSLFLLNAVFSIASLFSTDPRVRGDINDPLSAGEMFQERAIGECGTPQYSFDIHSYPITMLNIVRANFMKLNQSPCSSISGYSLIRSRSDEYPSYVNSRQESILLWPPPVDGESGHTYVFHNRPAPRQSKVDS